ncbi:BnaA02g11370D [Brassica napus]|uniref:BnaA02g11370D protein n=1 Tax=Brassica napus TaxID=3708 RepID=A0A078FV96_BRANA|nr:BnaA02g11370D [Brassica napus]
MLHMPSGAMESQRSC